MPSGSRYSFILRPEHKPLAVDHLSVLCDRQVDAGASLGIDQFDGLRHLVGIFAAVLHRYKAQGRSRPCASCGRLSVRASCFSYLS